jgi:Sec-independent protein translocase protein TatA
MLPVSWSELTLTLVVAILILGKKDINEIAAIFRKLKHNYNKVTEEARVIYNSITQEISETKTPEDVPRKVTIIGDDGKEYERYIVDDKAHNSNTNNNVKTKTD